MTFFVRLKMEKCFESEKGDIPLFLGITSQGNILIRINHVFLSGGECTCC